MKYLFLILIIIAFISSSCIPKKCKIAGAYNFVIPVTLSPAKDTFRIGDTITISSRFSDQVYERRTDDIYTLENFRFFPHTGIDQINLDTTDRGALASFEVLVDSIYTYYPFYYSSGSIRLLGEYMQAGEDYHLVCKLIPKKKGLYFFGHYSLASRFGDEQDFDGKCTNKRVEVVVEMNNRANNNIDMLKDSPDPHYNKWMLEKPGDRFNDKGGYCFYVKE